MKISKLFTKNQAGISLVQVLMASGMVAGIALLLAKLGQNSAMIQRSANISNDIYQTVNMMEKLLLNNLACTRTLGAPIAIPIGVPQAIPEIRDFFESIPPVPGERGNVVYALNNMNHPNLEIVEMFAIRGNGVGVNPYPWSTNEIHLEVMFQKKNEDYQSGQQRRSFGGETIKKTFIINARFNASNEVERCFSNLDNVVSDTLEAVCLGATFMGGTAYNRGTGVCTLPPNPGFSALNVFNASGNGSTTANNYDYCALARVGGEDGWKDSTLHDCRITKVGNNWTLKSTLDEGRSNYCRMYCFRL